MKLYFSPIKDKQRLYYQSYNTNLRKPTRILLEKIIRHWKQIDIHPTADEIIYQLAEEYCRIHGLGVTTKMYTAQTGKKDAVY